MIPTVKRVARNRSLSELADLLSEVMCFYRLLNAVC